jgi:hypothetical protein
MTIRASAQTHYFELCEIKLVVIEVSLNLSGQFKRIYAKNKMNNAVTEHRCDSEKAMVCQYIFNTKKIIITINPKLLFSEDKQQPHGSS